jgi:predicted methyltransferase
VTTRAAWVILAAATLAGGWQDPPDRDEWQQSERVMDVLHIADGSRVAELEAGRAWFTTRLAHRVGPNGRVYAQDSRPEMVEAIQRRLKSEDVKNIQPILGKVPDAHLPEDLNAVLIVDAYTRLVDPVRALTNVTTALAPSGLVGIVDFKSDGAGGPGPPLPERVDPEKVIRDAERAGLRLRSRETFLRYQYFLVFGRR